MSRSSSIVEENGILVFVKLESDVHIIVSTNFIPHYLLLLYIAARSQR